MISKQRLEELIEQGATIYKISKETFIAGVSDLLKIDKVPSGLYRQEINDRIGQEPEYNLLFETEEDARWELEMTATRTETLKLPHFIEVCDGCIYDITFIDNKKCKWQLTISDNGIALLDFALLGRDKFWNKLTKENYIEACKLAKKLFLGEEV